MRALIASCLAFFLAVFCIEAMALIGIPRSGLVALMLFAAWWVIGFHVLQTQAGAR